MKVFFYRSYTHVIRQPTAPVLWYLDTLFCASQHPWPLLVRQESAHFRTLSMLALSKYFGNRA
jgi:hypothetical protein